MELNSIYTLQHFAMGTKEQKARMTRRLTSEMQSWPELTGNGDTLFGCSPWLNYTTLITNLVRRRFSKGVAFRSSCSRQWEVSATIPYLLHTELLPAQGSQLALHRTELTSPADVNEGRAGQLPIQQHLTLTATHLPTPPSTSQLTSSSPSTSSKRQLFMQRNLSQQEKQNNPFIAKFNPTHFQLVSHALLHSPSKRYLSHVRTSRMKQAQQHYFWIISITESATERVWWKRTFFNLAINQRAWITGFYSPYVFAGFTVTGIVNSTQKEEIITN